MAVFPACISKATRLLQLYSNDTSYRLMCDNKFVLQGATST